MSHRYLHILSRTASAGFVPCQDVKSVKRNTSFLNRRLTAFFTNSENAREAAFTLSKNYDCTGEILLESISSEEASISEFSLQGTIFGACLGTVLGIAAAMIPNVGLFSTIGPLTGLIVGAVVGSIVGSLIDLLSYEEFPECSSLELNINNENGGSISKWLKKRGASKIVVTKNAAMAPISPPDKA